MEPKKEGQEPKPGTASSAVVLLCVHFTGPGLSYMSCPGTSPTSLACYSWSKRKELCLVLFNWFMKRKVFIKENLKIQKSTKERTKITCEVISGYNLLKVLLVYSKQCMCVCIINK